jgi:DNA polymerase I-like protein with 3'-5' exonuclease and polymerase domains
MQAYCEQDVEVNHTILRHIEAKNYSTRALDLEMDFATIIARQEQHGFAFDVNAAVKLQGVLQRRRDELKARLQETFAPRVIPMKTPAYWKGDVVELGTPYDSGWSTQQFATKAAALKAGARNIVKGPPRTKTIPFNPGSRLQIAERLSELHGWTPTEFTEDGQAKVDDVILGSLPYPEAKLLAEYLMVEKRIGQLAEGDEAWLKLERNGRIHGKVNTGGAVTGRCTHSNPNVAQVPSCGTKEDPVPYGPDCRSLFVASPGFVLVGCDAEGLELRGLSHFMAFYDGGAYGQAVVDGKKELGTDAHTLNQKAAGLSSRDVAKTFIYAFIYGAGDNKLGLITGVTPEEVRDFQVRYKSKWRMVAEREARQGFPSDPLSVARTLKGGMLRSKFLAGLPALRQLIDAVKTRAKESNRWIRGIDGRLLCVRSLHSCLNTLIQSAGAVVMKQALVFLYRDCLDRGWVWGRDFAFVANIHDEYQAEVRPEIAQDYRRLAAAAITRAGEAFGFRCRLDGSASEPGANWRDTH